MPALVLYALLGWNFTRHLRGLSTICSSHRPYVGPRQFLVGWGVLTTFMAVHYCRPFARAAAAAIADAIDDIHDVFEEQ